MSLRGILWLFVLWAFVLPSAVLPAVAATPKADIAVTDCPLHATALEHGPNKNSGKDTPKPHPAGQCCLVASHGIALPAIPEGPKASVLHVRPAFPAARDLAGISLNKDPPPPRV